MFGTKPTSPRPRAVRMGISRGQSTLLKDPLARMMAGPLINIQLRGDNLFRQAVFAGGDWIAADTGDLIEMNNPATGTAIGQVPKFGATETAVEAARIAAWRQWTLHRVRWRRRQLRGALDERLATPPRFRRLFKP